MTKINLKVKSIAPRLKGLTDVEHDIVEFLSNVDLSSMELITATEHELARYVNAVFQQHGEYYIEEYGNMEDALIEIYQSMTTLSEKLQKQLLDDSPL